ncbi:DUF6520 family protein [Chryseobacterium scophthalmum]|uniref:DUF6520 family protein n=1 Tax=Chryseobacterium scophthalmum TaxID=59733 RepID=UPI003CFE0542
MKKFIIPAILVSLGTGAAFAGTANEKKTKSLIPAYRIVTVGENQTVCVDAQQSCDDVETPNICKWSSDTSVNLHRFDTPTMCGELLYKIP